MTLVRRRLFAEQSLEQIGCANRLAMSDRQAQMRDAGFEIVEKARCCAWQLAIEALDELFFGQASQHRGGGSIGGQRLRSDFPPALGGHFAFEITRPMRQTTLP